MARHWGEGKRGLLRGELRLEVGVLANDIVSLLMRTRLRWWRQESASDRGSIGGGSSCSLNRHCWSTGLTEPISWVHCRLQEAQFKKLLKFFQVPVTYTHASFHTQHLERVNTFDMPIIPKKLTTAFENPTSVVHV